MFGLLILLSLKHIHLLGMQPNEVKEIVQNHLKELLVKHFDPERADNIFQRAGQVVLINNLTVLEFQ